MAFRTKLETKGFEAYLERLANAGRDIDSACDEALLAGGGVLLEGMQSRVPVDTGNLKDKLELSAPQRDGNVHFIEIGLPKSTDGTTMRYAMAQEYGWGRHKGHPFIRPTVQLDTKKAREKMRKVFEAYGAGLE